MPDVRLRLIAGPFSTLVLCMVDSCLIAIYIEGRVQQMVFDLVLSNVHVCNAGTCA